VIDCPNCGHQNPDGTDFCVRCGEYLRWNPTRVTPRPGEPPPGADLHETVVNPDAVHVTLRSTDAGLGDGSSSAQVTPGERTSITAVVRNQDTVVDTYALRIEGLPASWWSVTPPSIHLLPYGSSDSGYEQEVVVSLHPPRVPESVSRSWPFRLEAVSGARPGLTGEAAGSLVVARFDDLTCTLRPERRTGASVVDYEVIVRNGGNTATAVRLSASDPEEAMRFRFVPTQLQLANGDEWTLELRVEADPADRERELRFNIAATSDRATAASAGVFVQQLPARKRGWLRFLRIALTLLAVLILAVAGSPEGLVVGIVALAGLRRERAAMIAGFLALLVLLVLAAGNSVEAALVGAVFAFIAGFLRVLESNAK
jgi:hypothetical protein